MEATGLGIKNRAHSGGVKKARPLYKLSPRFNRGRVKGELGRRNRRQTFPSGLDKGREEKSFCRVLIEEKGGVRSIKRSLRKGRRGERAKGKGRTSGGMNYCPWSNNEGILLETAPSFASGSNAGEGLGREVKESKRRAGIVKQMLHASISISEKKVNRNKTVELWSRIWKGGTWRVGGK